MAERILPRPDAFATCPYEGKVLEYYVGTFEAVYVILHPFIQAISIGVEQFNPATYPDCFTVVANCAAVSWAEVAVKAGLPSISAVDVGLRTLILGLKEELADATATAGHYNVFTPDIFSFLCSSRRKLVDIREKHQFEGFFCTPDTEVYWSVRP